MSFIQFSLSVFPLYIEWQRGHENVSWRAHNKGSPCEWRCKLVPLRRRRAEFQSDSIRYDANVWLERPLEGYEMAELIPSDSNTLRFYTFRPTPEPI